MKNNLTRAEVLKKIQPKLPYQICTRSVMDTTDPDITFDENGVCNHVLAYDEYIKKNSPTSEEAKRITEKAVDNIKKMGRGKEYNCILGLSGGVDSSYTAWHITKNLGLKPLIVHVDAGWNNEIAVKNIQNVVERLNLDLHTIVINWEVIKDLQLSYFKASIANLDVPQDHVFIASLYKEANKHGIKYIINGNNMSTESILPSSWGYDASDSIQIRAIHKQFGSKPLVNYPMVNLFDKLIYYPRILGIESFSPLDLISYRKKEAKEFLTNSLGWKDYGGKHYESKFTRFFQAHYLPEKFGYDKRRAHLSSLIVSGQMTRDEALMELNQPLYDPSELRIDREFFIKKLGISAEEYDRIMKLPVRSYIEYPNGEDILRKLRVLYKPIKKIIAMSKR